MYSIIKNFENLKVMVIGDAMLDIYYCGDSSRICREAPVPIVKVDAEKIMPGGAANTALNVSKLGAKCFFVSAVGHDRNGQLLKEILNNEGVDTKGVITVNDRTITKQRVMADDQMIVRFDNDSRGSFEDEYEKKIIAGISKFCDKVDCIIISDYEYGVISKRVYATLKSLVKKKRKLIAIDAKHPKKYTGFPATFIKPNFKEAYSLIGKGSDYKDRVDFVVRHKKALLSKFKTDYIAVTLDTEGSIIIGRDRIVKKTTLPGQNSKAAGAGDTFTSALALSLASESSIDTASEIASTASRIVVRKEFTAVCTKLELVNTLSQESKLVGSDEEIHGLVRSLKLQRKKIVFTNGCFDILHSGHTEYLKDAKALGDILIVGLNSDSSIRKIKGSERPINTLIERVKVLSSLESVDFIIPFAENTPVELVEKIKPEIYVKGGDYRKELLPETPIVENHGGQVKILDYHKGHSTTGIINKIRQRSVISV